MKVVFLSDFGNSKKGTSVNLDSNHAASLIRKGVCKAFDAKEEKPKAPKKAKKEEPKTE